MHQQMQMIMSPGVNVEDAMNDALKTREMQDYQEDYQQMELIVPQVKKDKDKDEHGWEAMNNAYKALTDEDYGEHEDTHTHTWENAEDARCTVCNKKICI